MNVEFLDRIGEWNPQFYREIKGKLRWRNLIATVVISIVFQALLVLFNSSGAEARSVDWESIYRILNWLLPMSAIALGVYQIASDLSREQIRGTLDFVRLSPQSSENILSGKLLGVPLLLYLGIVLILPLHLAAGATLIAGLPAGKAFFALFGMYPVWVGLSGIYYNIVAFLALVSPKGDLKLLPAASGLLAIGTGPIAIATILRPNWMLYPGLEAMGWNWFFLPESFSYLWLLATLFALNLWIWQATNRCFRNPNHTLISKAQSYWVVGCTQLWLLGFALPDAVTERLPATSVAATFLFATASITILLMATMLSPTRQTLLDWARYRHQQSAQKRALWRDLLLGEKSPSTGAIAVHVVMIAIAWMPWLVLFLNSPNFSNEIDSNAPALTPLRFVLSFLVTASVFFNYATLYQTTHFSAKNSKHEGEIAAPWFGAVLSPIIVAALFQLSPARVPVLWLLTPVPFVGGYYASTFTLFAVFLGQLTFIGFFLRRFQRQLQRGAGHFSKNKSTLDKKP